MAGRGGSVAGSIGSASDCSGSSSGSISGNSRRGGRNRSRAGSCSSRSVAGRGGSVAGSSGSSSGSISGTISGSSGSVADRSGLVCDNWTSSLCDVTVNQFVRNVGPQIPLSNGMTTFSNFITDEIVAIIVRETNRYSRDCESNFETYDEEIKAFLGFIILMGIVRLPHLYDYWSTNPLLHYFPIANKISRRRFLDIRRYLHFVNNSQLPQRGEDGYNRLGKIQPIIDLVKKQTVDNYLPHKENSIDEAMIRFKGRSSLKQYLPLKPIKRGIKTWVRADSTNGYISEFEIYTGKEGDQPTRNLGENVVKKLSQTLVGGNYHLYFDNYFTTIPLLQQLLQDDIYACGTFRADRKFFPRELKDIKQSNSLGDVKNNYYILLSI